MPDSLIAERYRLSEEIGCGGEARVFRAVDLQKNHDVAIRLPLHAQGKPELFSVPMTHPNWVQLLDCGSDSSRGFFQVFELLHGETLSHKVMRAPLEEKSWLEFVHQSLAAVEALHAAGWVHGDLNTDNFFYTTNAAWKLLELPFFRLFPPVPRSTLFGGIHTLSPEQFKGLPVTELSDLYSLGCLYYYAAAGEYPHAGSSVQEIVVSLLRFAPAPLEEKVTTLPSTLSAWVMNLLERDPQKRPASASAARRML